MDIKQSAETSAAEAKAEEASQEASVEATPAQEETVDQTASDTKKEEAWEYNGDRGSVPEPFKKYATAFDRYVSKKDQALAEARKQLEEAQNTLNSDEFKRWKASQASEPAKEATSEAFITQDEADAIALGDTKTIQSVIDREIKRRLESSVTPIARKQKELETAETIKEFTDIHPDFKDLLDGPVGPFMINAANQGLGLDDIYKGAKEAEAWIIERENTRKKQIAAMKKDGSVVGRSVSGTPDVVYADSEDQAKRLAIELTLKGDKRSVQVRRK